MAALNLTQTDGWFIRINYWDGDVLDQNMPVENVARGRARVASMSLKADVDVCHGASVVATYRNGAEMADQR